MDMKEFYEKYNLNKCEFASIAGVGIKSLVKFANGEPVRVSTRKRIEKAMRIAEKYNMVRPKFDYGLAFGFFGHSYKSGFHEDVDRYIRQFKWLIEEEEEL